MRRIAVVAILVMLLVSSGTAFAFDNEPDGFRGLKWGDPPTEEMEFMRNLNEMLAVYRNPGEDNKLGDAKFYMMLHSFYVPPGASVKRYMVLRSISGARRISTFWRRSAKSNSGRRRRRAILSLAG